jgi:hypothetical protein
MMLYLLGVSYGGSLFCCMYSFSFETLFHWVCVDVYSGDDFIFKFFDKCGDAFIYTLLISTL